MEVMHTRDRMMNGCPTSLFPLKSVGSIEFELHLIRVSSATDWIEVENREGSDIWQRYSPVTLSVKFHLNDFPEKCIVLLVTGLSNGNLEHKKVLEKMQLKVTELKASFVYTIRRTYLFFILALCLSVQGGVLAPNNHQTPKEIRTEFLVFESHHCSFLLIL